MKQLSYNNYTSRFSIIRRHSRIIWPYLNVKKIINIIRSFLAQFLGSSKIKSKPYFIKLEPTNRCNLHCKGCSHAFGKEKEFNKNLGDLDFKLFQKIINELQKYLVKVSLYSMGEPLIYPKISEMIKYLSERKIGSVISSNLNYLPDNLARDLVENKLTHLIVGLDGACEEDYSDYRQGGNFTKVINNIKKIQKEKEKQKSKYPILEIQMIKFGYTKEKDILKTRKLAKNLGADNFFIKNDLGPYYANPKPQKKKCFWLYASPSINFKGRVEPCCYYYGEAQNNFGDISQEEFKNIWNNHKFQAGRKYFKTGQKAKNNLRCYNCNFFKFK